MSTPDDLTATLDQIRERGYRNGATGAECARLSDSAAEDVPLLLAAIEAVLKAHEPIQIYESADGCDHPCPVAANGRGEYHHGKPEYSEWDEWNDNHPYGEGLDDSSSDRICLLTPRSMACPACSKLVYDTWGDDDRYIDASDCLVRPAITAELAKGEGGDAG